MQAKIDSCTLLLCFMVLYSICCTFKVELYVPHKMKKRKVLAFGLCVLFGGTVSIMAQEIASKPTTVKKTPTLTIDKSNIKVKRHTVMERFEPDFVVTADERMEKKQQRVVDTELKLKIIDTLNVSDRKKRKLLLDLKYAPYSDRLQNATLVDTEFEDTSDNH